MKTQPLDAIEIPVPCTASWEAMRGDERKRFCTLCKLHVYNLSEMPRKEAETLVSGASGKVCVRLYRRPDGTVLTRHCRRLVAFRRAAGALAAGFLAALFGASAMSCRKETGKPQLMGKPMPPPVPAVTRPPGPRMGDVCLPPVAPPKVDMGATICPPKPEPPPARMGKVACPLPPGPDPLA